MLSLDSNKAISGDSLRLARELAKINSVTKQLRHFSIPEHDLFIDPQAAIVSFELPSQPTAQEGYHIKRAEELMARVKMQNRFVKYLDASALVDLPIGVVSEDGKEDYAILIDSLVIKPTHAYLTVYMCVPIPQSDKKLVFRGDNIRLSKEGGITGDARVFLVNDVDVRLFGKDSKMIIRGGADKTYAVWDCDGFKETNIIADIEFSRNWVVPLKGDGNVKSHFETKISSWSELVATVNIEPFSVPSLRGVEFHSGNVIFDYSDFHTPENIKFPEDYKSPQFIDNDKKLWRGFYMESLKVLLPKEFKKRGDDAQLSIYAQNMLIDNLGFTGTVDVKNLFALREGDMNGWDYSLDSLGLIFVANDLVGAGFNGKIMLPVGDDKKPFDYTAIINPGTSYVFNVAAREALNFDIWSAKVLLREGSYLDVRVADGKFKPKAVLNGRMDVKVAKDEMSLFHIQFEELMIMSEAPYLDAKAFSFGSEKLEHTLKDFPISISRIGFTKKVTNKIALNFTIGVHLTGQDDGAFRGDATFELRSKLHDATRKWTYDGVAISEVGVDVDGGSYKIKGRIKIFEDDVIYGKGYNGTVALYFQPGFELNGTVIFGKVDGYRYWYADGFVGFPTGIPFCGFLAFYGFGGGMYHNMEQVGYSKDQALSAGKSLSGVIYKPNNKIRYGFKATIQIGLTSSKETFNGDATFEISFLKTGGVKRISLIGNAYMFMSQQFGDTKEIEALVDKMSQHKDSYGEGDATNERVTHGLKPPDKDALISGHLFHYYDFENDVFHGEMEMYVDVFGALKGIGPDGLAGWSVMHYGRDEWYLYIGTPDRRVGLSVLGLVTMDGYFMTGDEIPGSPPPPENVSRILGDIDLDYMRDENALGTGKGVALGGSFLLDTGDKKFLMFYGRFAMGAGFDIMLKNYGDDVRCKGRSSTLGINGWYANGQAYAFVEGKIGIRFKLFGRTKKKEILSLGVAVVLQSKMPNPFWMRGIVGGRYSIMGGLIKGHCKFKLTIGEECEIIDGSVLNTLTVISEVTPATNSRDVDVFTTPQAVFNIPVEQAFMLEDVDGVMKGFRVKLEHFKVTDGKTEIPGSIVWNDEKNVAAFQNLDILPPLKELKAEVMISFEESLSSGWTPVKLKGEKILEKLEVLFQTGTAPDHIPVSNVAFSYPQLSQFNFYKDEYSQGYIQLKKGQPYLFSTTNVWVQTGRFVTVTGSATGFNFSYSDREINFDIPKSLAPGTLYALEIVNIPSTQYQTGNIDRNVKQVTTQVDPDLEVTTNEAEGTIQTLSEKVLFQGYFRTSKFNTFQAKFNSLNTTNPWMFPDPSLVGVYDIGVTFNGAELFDKAELTGTTGQSPLLRMSANLDGNKWYWEDMHPFLYKDFPFLPGMRISGRDLALGMPPVRATFIKQDNNDREVSPDDLSNSNPVNSAFIGKVSYELDHYMRLDYRDVIGMVANWHASNFSTTTERVKYMLSTPYPLLRNTLYNVDLEYVLPGKNIVTTKKTITINLVR